MNSTHILWTQHSIVFQFFDRFFSLRMTWECFLFQQSLWHEVSSQWYSLSTLFTPQEQHGAHSRLCGVQTVHYYRNSFSGYASVSKAVTSLSRRVSMQWKIYHFHRQLRVTQVVPYFFVCKLSFMLAMCECCGDWVTSLFSILQTWLSNNHIFLERYSARLFFNYRQGLICSSNSISG